MRKGKPGGLECHEAGRRGAQSSQKIHIDSTKTGAGRATQPISEGGDQRTPDADREVKGAVEAVVLGEDALLRLAREGEFAERRAERRERASIPLA
jgi:hypothetical protein